jgi:hypothetical protein
MLLLPLVTCHCKELQYLNPWTINHVSGPEAGDLLTAGSYTLCYELVNPDGDAVEDCCFDINVAGFPNASATV